MKASTVVSGSTSAARSGFRPWLTLARPANVVTAWADVLAGFAVATAASGVAVLASGAPGAADLLLLLLGTTGLYAGGVVLNDVFDADLDATERPERPIPSGHVSRGGAGVFGGLLLALGVSSAFAVGVSAGVIAALIALCALTYDGWGKHRPYLGPLNMGACRGGNLLLGMAAAPAAVPGLWFLALIPLAYITAVTAISRGEVHGGSRSAGVLSVALIVAILLALVALSLLSVPVRFSILPAMPFLLPFAGIVQPAFGRGARRRDPDSIRRAVKTGVLLLILLDASVAAGYGGIGWGAATAALLPVSVGLARLFAVT